MRTATLYMWNLTDFNKPIKLMSFSLLCLIHVIVYNSIYSVKHHMSYTEIAKVIPVLLISGIKYFALGQ